MSAFFRKRPAPDDLPVIDDWTCGDLDYDRARASLGGDLLWICAGLPPQMAQRECLLERRSLAGAPSYERVHWPAESLPLLYNAAKEATMRRLLIVDDNPWDREGVRSAVDWQELGIEIIGDSANGKAALEAAGRLLPDIILSDVVMPVMNGIEMAKLLKTSHPAVRIIFMSAYNEFDFARSALDLDAYGYVLKPISADELRRAVGRILTDIREEARRAQEKREMLDQLSLQLPFLHEQFFRDLLFGTFETAGEVAERMEFLGLPQAPGSLLRVALIHFVDSEGDHRAVPVDDRYARIYSVRKRLESSSAGGLSVHSVRTSYDELVLVLISPDAPGEADTTLDWLIAMREDLVRMLRLNIRVSISKSSHDLLDAPFLYRQTAEAVNAEFHAKDAQLIRFEEIGVRPDTLFGGNADFAGMYKDLRDCISFGDEKSVDSYVSKYLGSEQNPGINDRDVKTLALFIVTSLHVLLMEERESLKGIFGSKYNPWSELERLPSLQETKRWLENLLLNVKADLRRKHQSVHEQIVQRIRETVHSRYGQTLTISDVAESVHYSAVHANNLFRRSTGKTIFDYLTEYRLERAKELLKDPLSKIYLVAEQVGYSNISHFSLLFRKYAGVTPSEYKRSAVF